jgi:quercetin dioxygenase-like cupin family protein
MGATKYIVDQKDCRSHDLFPGVRIFATAGDHVMLSLVEFEPRAVVPSHSHPHEQMGLLLEGELSFTIGGETHLVKPGQMWRIPGGTEHQVVAGDCAARALDVFHPVREDYR